MKQRYVFGYLFVRLAKTLTIIVVSVAALFTVLRLQQARTQAEAYAYVSNDTFEHRLLKLNEEYRTTLSLLSHLMAKGSISVPTAPQFPKAVQSSRDFDQVAIGLAGLSLARDQIKQSVIERFETSIRQIELTLRAHAATIHAENSSTHSSVSPNPTSPQQTSLETLYSSKVDASDARARTSELEGAKQYLRLVGGSAEDPKNKQVLIDSINELDQLEALLMSVQKLDLDQLSSSVSVEAPAKLLDAEKVAVHLSQLLASVRVAVLSSWSLDDALDGAIDLADAEAAKSRIARLAVRGVWLGVSQLIVLVVFGSAFLAFIILAGADVIQALLDTAKNTGAIAEKSPQ